MDSDPEEPLNVRTCAVILLLGLAAGRMFGAQSKEHRHAPGVAAAAAEAGHHACLEQERAALERGEGFGMGLVADHNGYPGPRHVLDLKAELQLAPEQQAAMEGLFARMKQQALARGKEVLAAEARLDEMFTQARPEAELREQSFRTASLRAELRWAHLSAHLAARKLLTPEQLAAYQRLRQGPVAARPSS
jgi:Spy/CpxP family protein refolding chaperone